MERISAILVRLVRDEEAPTSLEYAIMVGLVAAAVIGGTTILGLSTDGLFRTFGGILSGLAGG